MILFFSIGSKQTNFLGHKKTSYPFLKYILYLITLLDFITFRFWLVSLWELDRRGSDCWSLMECIKTHFACWTHNLIILSTKRNWKSTLLWRFVLSIFFHFTLIWLMFFSLFWLFKLFFFGNNMTLFAATLLGQASEIPWPMNSYSRYRSVCMLLFLMLLRIFFFLCCIITNLSILEVLSCPCET